MHLCFRFSRFWTGPSAPSSWTSSRRANSSPSLARNRCRDRQPAVPPPCPWKCGRTRVSARKEEPLLLATTRHGGSGECAGIGDHFKISCFGALAVQYLVPFFLVRKEFRLSSRSISCRFPETFPVRSGRSCAGKIRKEFREDPD